MAISSPGIGLSGNIDVNGIISKLMEAEGASLTPLSVKEVSYKAKLSAYGGLTSALASFQTALAGLSSPTKFQSSLAASSDNTIVAGTSSTGAVAGSYNVSIQKLAQAQTLVTNGVAATNTPIGDGTSTTITFSFGTITGGKLVDGKYVSDAAAVPPDPAFALDGDQAGGSIVIDSSNNTLQGIRDAINKAGMGVTATIVSDGSATPNRLVLTSNKTGATSSMNIAVSGNADLASMLAYDATGTQNLKQTAVGQNSEMTVNGIAVTSKTRTVTDAIQGVTLNLGKIGDAVLTVANDTGSVENAVAEFVKSYNDLNKVIKNLTAYDPLTKKAGALIGDRDVQDLQNQLRNMLAKPVEGAAGNYRTLQSVGVEFQRDGTLLVNSTKLSKAITDNFKDVGAVFSSMLSASDSLITLEGSTSATTPGVSEVFVQTLATKGNLTATGVPGTLNIQAGVNDAFTITINGVETQITIPAKVYDNAAALATQLQSSINGASNFKSADISVEVTVDGTGKLVVTSNRYGSASTVAFAGNGADNLFGASPVAQTGVDVAGTINGVAATGSGQFLTGAPGTIADGLKLRINGGSAPADRGTVNFSQGYAYQLDKLMNRFLGSTGSFTRVTEGINKSIADVAKSKEAMNLRLNAVEKRYRAQFTALDVMIGRMSQTSAFLTQQLAAMQANNG